VPFVTGVSHLGLTVRNLAKSEEWYGRVFGLERVHHDRGPQSELVVLHDPDSEMVISLRHYFNAGSARFDGTRTGLDRVSFGVTNRAALDVWERRLEELGIDHQPVIETEFGSMLVFRDPDFIQLELFWRRRSLMTIAAEPPAAAKTTKGSETSGTGGTAEPGTPAPLVQRSPLSPLPPPGFDAPAASVAVVAADGAA
jgi:catechol 2,3-dioxygenase-like lactoylglutathione lyase family enzyme